MSTASVCDRAGRQASGSRSRVAAGLVGTLLGALPCSLLAAQSDAAASRFERVRADLTEAIAVEMERCALPGVAIAVADGERVVWSAGFGIDDPGRQNNLRGNTPFRVASISKLFTDTAVMVAVERGDLDLDADVQTYTPGVRPRGFEADAITLRLLMTHRAGLVREPRVGHYFDLAPPPLRDVVASLADTALVAAPGQMFKYSNAGLAWVGHIAATRAGVSFEAVIARDVLQPLGLGHLTFAGNDRADVVQGAMWTYDGRAIVTPRVDLGLGPATNLCASMDDLVRCAQSWFVGAHRGPRALLREETLRAMFTPQWKDAAVGLGFFLDRFGGHLRVSHEGAYYGVASQVAALPEQGIAVAVATTVDFAAGPVQRLLDRAMRGVLAARAEQPLPPQPALRPVGRERARGLAGVYGEGAARVELLARDDRLWLRPASGLWLCLSEGVARDSVIAADRGTAWQQVALRPGALQLDGVWRERLPDAPPPACPAALLPFLGEYGFDHDVLIVGERDGHLALLIEWLAEYPLRPVDVAAGVFALARDGGMYRAEEVRFARDGVHVGAVWFPYRPLLGVDGGAFRIEPRFPKERLLAMARQARAPSPTLGARAFDLVELRDLDPTLRYDVRYATADNFMGFALYDRAEAKLQRPAAEALVRVQRGLAARGLGLLIHDAYRPWLVTKMFFDATPEAQHHFVANPTRGSRHNRGCAVDLTLCELESGQAIEMPSLYDEFTPRAYPAYPGGTSRQRYFRALLRAAMEAEGFAVYEFEWWHFDFEDWERYPVK